MIYNITIVEWTGVEWTPVPHHLAAFWVESTGLHMDSGGDSKVLVSKKMENIAKLSNTSCTTSCWKSQWMGIDSDAERIWTHHPTHDLSHLVTNLLKNIISNSWTVTQSTQFKVRKKGQHWMPSFFKLTEILPWRCKCNSMNVANLCTIMYWCIIRIRRYLPDILSNPAIMWLSNRYTTRGVDVSGSSSGSPLSYS